MRSMRRKIHRLLRPYIRLAVDNVLEAHESIETELGPLQLLAETFGRDSGTGSSLRGGQCMRLPTVFVRSGGSAMGSVRADENSERWSVIAAYVAAVHRQLVPSRRVRVVEIGVLDGSSVVLFDGTAAEARAEFLAMGGAVAAAAADDDHVVPCRSCGDCKAAGACRALVPVDGCSGSISAASVHARFLLASLSST